MRSIKFIGALALAVFIAGFATTAFAQLACPGGDADCAADLCSDGTCIAGFCNPAIVCTALDQCHDAGVCDSSTGICSDPNAVDGTSCNDNNVCTSSDICTGGICAGTNNTAACSDNNACTLNDTCAGGVCVSGTAKVCTASDQCHVAGTCNTGTGVCSNPVKTNGTSCNDNNACTLNDVCASGACKGTTKNCSDNNVCTIDTCTDTVTGVCSNAPTGTSICGLTGTPLPAMTKLKITPGVGSASNTPCTTGSCFGMEVATGVVTWTDFGPGTDGGIVIGKAQLSGGQEGPGGGSLSTPGELSDVWNFFGSNGTFFTSPGGDTKNIYDSAPCSGADCIYKTELKVFNVSWNGNIIPMGSEAGCIHANCSDNQKNGINVNDWQIDPVTGGVWSMNYTQVVPSGGFAGVKFTAIMRGTVELVECATNSDCNDGTLCTDDTCDTTTNLCVFTNNGVCAPTAPTLVHPSDGQTGLRTTVELRWEKSIDPENAPITYKVYLCTDSTFSTVTDPSCAPITVASRSSDGMFYAGGAGVFMIGMTFFGGLRGKRRIVLLFMVLFLFAGGTIISCKAKDETELPANQMNYIATGLSPNKTYHWKVTADNGKTGGLKESAVQSFTTQ